MTFHHPSIWFLLGLLLLPLLWWRMTRSQPAMSYSSIAPLQKIQPGIAVHLRWIIPIIRIAALGLLIVALARPQKTNERAPIISEGIAIELIIDKSGSMKAMDFELDGERVDRLAAVKNVVEEFVVGGEDLPGRHNDLIGVISFATYADSSCPLTLDHAHLIETVKQVEVPALESERATAIGDAIALGVERIQGLQRRTDLGQDQRITSRVMILLTDGENTAGDIDPILAAQMAEAFDIRIYTIGAGSDRSVAPVPTQDPFTGRTVLRNMRVSIDEDMLREIAKTTGGRYFRATDSESLREIYAMIDDLERTEIQQLRYFDYRELAVRSIPVNGFNLPSLLAMVVVLLAAETALRSTRLQTIP